MDEVVAFLATELPFHGVETAVLHCGAAVEMPAGRSGGRLVDILRADGVKVVESDSAGGLDFLRAWAPDVISAHGTPDWVLAAADRMDIPFVETLHSVHTLLGGGAAREADRARRITGLVAVCDLVRRQYLEINPSFAPERIVTVPNAVRSARRDEPARAAARARLGLRDEMVFLSLGRYDLQKNTYGLVDAFTAVAAARADVHLLVAGRPDDPAYFAQTLRLRDHSPHAGRVHLRDHSPQPGELMAAADAFVLDSFFEGGPLVSMEALSSGLPVVISDVGAAREQIGVPGQRGFVVTNPLGHTRPADWDELRRATYERQPNKEELVTAMLDISDHRDEWTGRRAALREESALRFAPDPWAAAHAQVLTKASRSEPIGGTAAGAGARP